MIIKLFLSDSGFMLSLHVYYLLNYTSSKHVKTIHIACAITWMVDDLWFEDLCNNFFYRTRGSFDYTDFIKR